ncbi:MAG TPA: response regulator transcription factor [Steroidobacteraceae bacterium]|jgi:DNA-binding CsgD family transcriptional regulator|nr:response regulator transcription factor [Steroidobacteraceae bacterium]
MTESSVGSLVQPLRVAIAAQGEDRAAALTKLLQTLGHKVVDGEDRPDVVLADQHRPDEGQYPTVVLGGTDAEAEGILPGNAGAAEIDAALRAVARGLIVRSPAARASGFSAIQEAEARTLLTPREAQILDAIADGLTNKAIARRLGISLHTVKFHVESVFRKLGASTRTEAVAKATERRREETIDL